jgi:sigma-B regulation protein RsbU (phosphoserine phosphatase)
MDSHSAEYLLQVRELQLNSLFELIKSINENASEDDLYKIYKFIIHSIHKIDRLALFVKEDDWIYKVGYGNKAQLADLGLPPQVLAFRETHQITSQDELGHCAEFDTLIPIKHKGQVLAYVLIGQPERIDAHDLDFVATLSNIIIVAIENKKLVRKQVLQEIMDQQLLILVVISAQKEKWNWVYVIFV